MRWQSEDEKRAYEWPSLFYGYLQFLFVEFFKNHILRTLFWSNNSSRSTKALMKTKQQQHHHHQQQQQQKRV
jgi:hypothetical protein